MILIIDNYDSFTYNLYQYVGELGYEVKVVRNNKFKVQDIERLSVTHIILSPGSGHPKDSGLCQAVIKRYEGKIPILGVCLGHQIIAMVYGCVVAAAKYKIHGKVSKVQHSGDGIFKGIKNPCIVARYHSLIVSSTNFSKELIVTAWSKEEEIMAVRHREYPIYGIQFHPESIFTEQGRDILKNFLSIERV